MHKESSFALGLRARENQREFSVSTQKAEKYPLGLFDCFFNFDLNWIKNCNSIEYTEILNKFHSRN